MRLQEGLLHIGFVGVGRTRATVAAILQSAFELAKETDPAAQVEVGVEHVALQQVAVGVLRLTAPAAIVEELKTLPHLAAQRNIAVAVRREWNVLQQIQIILPPAGVFQVAVVLVGPLCFERRGRLRCCLRTQPRAQQGNTRMNRA